MEKWQDVSTLYRSSGFLDSSQGFTYMRQLATSSDQSNSLIKCKLHFAVLTILILDRGDAAFSEEDNAIAIDNTLDGFDLYSFDTGSFIKTFSATRGTTRYPRQVAFGEGGSVVIGGGNDGLIRVYDRRSGVTIDTLRHDSGTRGSQTLTVRRSLISFPI